MLRRTEGFYLSTHGTAFQAGRTFLWVGKWWLCSFFGTWYSNNVAVCVCHFVTSYVWRMHQLVWSFNLWAVRDPCVIKGKFYRLELCVCIICLSLSNWSKSRLWVCMCVTNYIHTWFDEGKWSVSVYYPHYACHGLTISLHNFCRIYLSLSPGGKRLYRTGPVFATNLSLKTTSHIFGV